MITYKYVITTEQLKKNFGEKIKVKGSTGVIEDDWKFVSPGYVLSRKSSFLIKVRRNIITQRILDIITLKN